MNEIKLEPVKPEKALAYWKTRRPLSKRELLKLEAGAKDRAMTVSGLTKFKQLNAVHHALNKALDEGTTLADFKKNISRTIEEQGWKSWRIENIFRTNLASAYAAGAWAEIEATKDAFPYLEYIAVDDGRTRPTHAVLNGKVYPVDHEFWQYNYPPNGFACRCTTAPVSKFRAERKGVKIEKDMPGPATFKGDGDYPIHVAAPGADKGFHGNVGQDWLGGLAPEELDDALNFHSIAGSGKADLPLEKIPAKHITQIKADDILPKGQPDIFYADKFLKEFGIEDLKGHALVNVPGTSLKLPVNKDLFIDKAKSGWHLKVNKEGRGPYMKLLAKTIKEPFEVWLEPVELSGRRHDALHFIKLFATESGNKKIGTLGVFTWVPGTGWKGSTTYLPSVGHSEKKILAAIEKRRRGKLLYRAK